MFAKRPCSFSTQLKLLVHPQCGFGMGDVTVQLQVLFRLLPSRKFNGSAERCIGSLGKHQGVRESDLYFLGADE